VGHVRGLEKEFVKFSDEFDKLGERILSLSRQYDQVGRTRVNQMNRIMDKVKLEDGSESDQPKLID
jgi:DNA anti-recombination protein RmuC